MAKNTILWIAGLIILLVLFGKNLIPQSAISTTEVQLKGEYITYWADRFDGDITTPNGENDRFTWTSRTNPTNMIDGESISTYNNVALKKDFYGQEVIILLSLNGEEGKIGEVKAGSTEGRKSGEYIYRFVPRTLDLSKVDVYVSGFGSISSAVPFTTLTVPKPFYITFNGNDQSNGRMVIDYIGYKAQFSCDLSSDEVWIHEDFAQSFTIKDLEFIPTKFCKDVRPFTLRDVQQGETAITPNPIPNFNKGNSLTPSTNTLIGVNYATYFVAGVNNKCSVNEANIKVGGKWICTQVINPVQITVQCQSNSDCPQPLKNTCPSYFTGCNNNKCTYDDTILNAPECKNEVVTIVKQIQEIEKRTIVPITGTNQFLFSQNTNRADFNIGDKTFGATQAQFTCPSVSGAISPPNPSSDCWSTKVTYGSESATLKDTQATTLQGGLIKVQYFASGTLTDGKYTNPLDWANNFIFTISSGVLGISVEDSSFVLQNSDKNVKMSINNKFPSGKILLKVGQKVLATNQNIPEQIISKSITGGNNSLSFKIDTSNLGLNQITVQAFYPIQANSEVLIPSDKFILSYNIGTSEPDIKSPVVITETSLPKSKIPLIVWIMVGAGTLIIFFAGTRKR